ncbi:MAG: PAS domain-containing protein, partial [Pseudonocardiaceae bacterium]
MSGSARPFSRAELARAWTDAVLPTAEVPLQREWAEECLRDQLNHLMDALGQSQFSPESAAEVGAKLVVRGFTGAQSLGRTVEILAHALLGQPELGTVDGLSGKVASLLGALVAGYTTALRRRVVEQDEDRFREVFDSAPVGIVISQLDGTIIQTNGALTEILRYSPAELAVREVSELFHPDDATLLHAAYQALRDGKRERFQNRVKLLAANGDTTWVALTVTVLCDAAGSPTHHVTMVEDFTDRQLL